MKSSPIRIKRMNLELDTKEAADKLGISTSTLYKLERGWTSPSAQLIKRLADTYGCTTDEIFKDLKITG